MEPSNISALFILISGIIGIIFIMAVGNLLRSRAKRTESVIDDIILSSIGKPLILFLVIITIYSSLAISTLIPAEYAWILDNRY